MIPLAQWLQERDGAGSASAAASMPAAIPVSEVADAPAGPDPVTTDPRPLIRDLEERLSSALCDMELQAEAARQREANVTQQLGADVVAKIEGEVRSGLAALQGAIESALEDVLAPFLEGQAATTARQHLLELLGEAIRNAAEPLLEVKAPASLHDDLRAAGSKWGIAVAIVDSETIELIFDSRRERFDELASRWRAIIAGGDDER